MSDEIRDDVLALVETGSMTLETIVDELADEYDRQAVKLEVVDMIATGELVEHPDFEGAYRVGGSE